MEKEEPKEEIQAKVIIEVLGKPKEHVEKSLRDFVDRIKQDKDIQILNEDFAEAREQDSMWSTFVELEFKIKNLSHMVGFCLDYMPSSIDIVSPESLSMNQKNLSDFLNDLQAKLHQIDMVAKQMRSQSEFMQRNMNGLINNMVTLLLRSAPLTAKQLEKFTGVPKQELEKFLDAFIEKKKVEKLDDKYRLIPGSPQS